MALRAALSLFLMSFSLFVWANDALDESFASVEDVPSTLSSKNSLEPFTGKITRNKVRLRLQPGLEGSIIRELSQGDLVLVTGESEEFYAVQPPSYIKAYVFRTFILDNYVEGKNVNVRLGPDLDAPIIAHLNSGDHVEGLISPLNSKWLEIKAPALTKFYVCKDFVENIGESTLLAQLEKRQLEVEELLAKVEKMQQVELQKPIKEMQLDEVMIVLNTILKNYADFPQQITQAKELLIKLQALYVQNKAMQKNTPLSYQAEIKTTVLPLDRKKKLADFSLNQARESKKTSWLPIEQAIYEQYTKDHEEITLDEFYEKQKKTAIFLTGIIKPFSRQLQPKPGDYLLLSAQSAIPQAYLYSTKVDLSTYVGQEVTLIAVPRPHYNFAHPAYFIFSIQ